MKSECDERLVSLLIITSRSFPVLAFSLSRNATLVTPV